MDLEHTDKKTTIIVDLSSDHRYYVNSDSTRISIAQEERLQAHRANVFILTPGNGGVSWCLNKNVKRRGKSWMLPLKWDLRGEKGNPGTPSKTNVNVPYSPAVL